MAFRRISWKVIKNHNVEIFEDILIAILVGLIFIGVSALATADLTGGDWLKDISPFFVALVSIYIAFSVLSVSLEENRKQAKLDRDLAVRPFVRLKNIPPDQTYPEELYVRFSIAKKDGVFFDEFGLLPRMDYTHAKLKAENSGLGPAFNIRLVLRIGGKFFISKGAVNQLQTDRAAIFRVSYTSAIEDAESLHVTYTDIYGNHHVVALMFDVRRKELVVIANQYLEQDLFNIAKEVVACARQDQTFVDDTLPK